MPTLRTVPKQPLEDQLRTTLRFPCWCLAKSQRANSRKRGCGHVEMLMMLLSDLAQERICDMVQDCRAQMTRPKNIHENPVQAPSKLKADILVKLRRVDIKSFFGVSINKNNNSLRRQHQTKGLAETLLCCA